MSTSFTGLTAVTTLATSDILAGDISGVSKSITAGNLRKAFFGFAANDPLNAGPITVVGNSTITGTLSGLSTVTCTTLIASSITANVTGNVSGSSGSCTGNSLTATTASAVAASAITGTTLAANVVSSSLTSHGTLVSGAVPASLVTAGTFAAGAFSFPAGLTVANGLTVTAGPVTFGAATTKIAVPAGGITDFRASGDLSSVLSISDTGVVQLSTGRLNLHASTTASASLLVPSGTAPSSPVDGEMWYNGTSLFFRNGGSTKTITWA